MPDEKEPVQKIRVLIIENDPEYALLLKKVLSKEKNPPFDVQITRMRRVVDYSTLTADMADVLLVDLPDRTRFHGISQLHSRLPHIPILVLTDFNDEKLALEAVRKGAQDYLVKTDVNPRMLSRVIRYAIGRAQARTELRRA